MPSKILRPERRYLPRDLAATKLEDRADDAAPAIIGYGAVYYDGTEASQYRLWESCVERILPGAFDRAISEDDCRALFNHDANLVLGRTKNGTCRLFSDSKGLRYEIDPADTQYARDLRACLKRGDVDGSSFSFLVTDQAWSTEDGIDVREIRGVQLFDVGPVTFPAYDATTAGARALADTDLVEARDAHALYRRSAKWTHGMVLRRARWVEIQEGMGA
jgi:hypothetical protein